MPRMRAGRPPEQAVGNDGTRALYVLKDGTPQAARSRPRLDRRREVEILSGLNEGDQVIIGSREPRG